MTVRTIGASNDAPGRSQTMMSDNNGPMRALKLIVLESRPEAVERSGFLSIIDRRAPT